MWRSCDIGRYIMYPNGTRIYQNFNDCVPVFNNVSIWQFYTYFAARTVFFVVPMSTGNLFNETYYNYTAGNVFKNRGKWEFQM